MPLRMLGDMFSGRDYDNLREIRIEQGFEYIAAIGEDGGMSPAEIAALMAQLEGLDLDRQVFVESALSLVGRIHYFWGGKSTAIGWDDRWGSSVKVTSPGSRTTGTYRSYGLDCSGLIAWAYAQIGVSPELMGWGTSGQWASSIEVDPAVAQPGDLVFFPKTGVSSSEHVGIVVGRNAAGTLLAVHCNSSHNNITVDDAFGFGFEHVRRPVIFPDERLVPSAPPIPL
jgi:hypothetical protein